jgi:hypothetical protein
MIKSIMIVEVAGSPPEYAKESLEKHVNVLKTYKGVVVNNIVISEPKEIEDAKGIFTCFAEIDFEVESFGILCDCVFDFMPSSIEVIEPGKFHFSNLEASNLLNIISGRMHRYDEIARFTQFKMGQMEEKMKSHGIDIKSEMSEKKESESIEENKEKVSNSPKKRKKSKE